MNGVHSPILMSPLAVVTPDRSLETIVWKDKKDKDRYFKRGAFSYVFDLSKPWSWSFFLCFFFAWSVEVTDSYIIKGQLTFIRGLGSVRL